MKNKKRIAIFGGSFDPVHTDHINIAIACHDKLNFDEVWMTPSWVNPFKQINVSSSVKDRLTMLQIATKNISFIKINEYEVHNQNVSFTYETVKYMIANFPNYDFEFIMGSDQLDNFELWNNFEDLIKIIKFNVFQRTEIYNEKIVKKYNLKVFTFNNNNISSTDIRNLRKINLQIPEINDYINNNLLYIEERVKSKMDNDRFIHCLNVGQYAKRLAIINGVDPNKAFIAGTLHDIAKRWEKSLAELYLKKYLPVILKEPEQIWHSYVGYLHLQKDWLINDQEILLAVLKHTVAAAEMSTLDMIVFVADKISYERNYPGVNELRTIANENLEKSFKMILKAQYDNAIKKHGENKIGALIKESYNFWIGEKK
ncbi:nicotinate-nucleotide adenylyltransferase [Spiroplasma endosymbiont of Labia minor]|uniref:nicotinate-nucleotide adenylyltransferase n=1 Tax=Spiroplasma endosymbiont of Labia minor TaxID=3066305 RepID=UPI0030D439C9